MTSLRIPEGPVTIMVTDIEGSTSMRTRVGDRRADDVLAVHDGLIREQLSAHDGVEVKTAGDGFLCVFASVRKAIACAAAIERELAAQASAVEVRIGLHTGEVAVRDDDISGEAVVAAYRICDLAQGGAIVCSRVTRELAGTVPGVAFADRGEAELKGFREPFALYAIDWRPVPPRRTAATAFVGRRTERGELERRLREAVAGRGALVLVAGEPGVGKTRLAREVAEAAGASGVVASWGHCYETEGAPYLPFVEMLESAREADPGGFRQALGEDGGEVARIMPALRRRYPDLPQPLDLPAEQERRYLFRALTAVLARQAETGPRMLVLDDLQWADGATLLFLEHLAAALDELPVLVVGTYRDTDLEVGRPLHRTLERLHRGRLAHRVVLKRLGLAEIGAMLADLAGQEAPPKLVDVVASETDGNAFFVEEVFAHLAEEGRLLGPDGRLRADLDVDELDVPEGVRLVVGRRLERLAESTRRVLEAAAVLGRTVPVEVLAESVEVDRTELLEAAAEAETAGVLVPEGNAGYRFSHELIRQTLLSSLSLARRQVLHLRVAEALEALCMDDPDEHAVEIAHHLLQAGVAADRDKTVGYLVSAGRRALEAAAYEAALTHLERALECGPPADLEVRAELWYRLGFARRETGRWDDATAAWEQALQAYEELGDGRRMAAVARAALTQLLWGGRYLDAKHVVSAVLPALDDLLPDRAPLLAALGAVHALEGRIEEAEPLADEALALGASSSDPEIAAHTLHLAGNVWIIAMHWLRGNELYLQAAERFREAGDLGSYCDVLSHYRSDCAWLGRFDDCRRLAVEVEELEERLGHLQSMWWSSHGRARTALAVEGSLEGCEREAHLRLEVSERGQAGFPGDALCDLGIVDLCRGRWDAAIEHLLEAPKRMPPGLQTDLALAQLLTGLAYLERREEALEIYEGATLPTAGRLSTMGRWQIVLHAVEALALLGERERSAALYPLALEAVPTGWVTRFFDMRLLQTLLGIAAAAGERWTEATEHFEAAMRQAEEMPHRLEQPEVRRWYAWMLIDRGGPGDTEKARRLLDEAVEAYRRIGMPRHVEMAEAMLP